MGKKGQAALEFLSTYGWAILAVVVMIGLFSYIGIYNFGNTLPDYCNLGPGLACQNPVFWTRTAFKLVGIGYIDMEITNMMGKDLVDLMVVIDPENEYCGGWLGLVSASGLENVPLVEGNATFIFRNGETKTLFNTMDLTKYNKKSYMYSVLTCGCTGYSSCVATTGGEHIYMANCCDSDWSKNYYNPGTGLCQNYIIDIDKNTDLNRDPTCVYAPLGEKPRNVPMDKLKRFSSDLWVFYRTKGSAVLHRRSGKIDVTNSGEWSGEIYGP